MVVPESQLVWREVKECLVSENFDKAVQLCNTGEASTSLSSRLAVCVFCLFPVVQCDTRQRGENYRSSA